MIFKKKSYYDEMPETETVNGDTPAQAQQEIPAERRRPPLHPLGRPRPGSPARRMGA